jgi:thiol-disulfide isomerase/thioredoxin
MTSGAGASRGGIDRRVFGIVAIVLLGLSSCAPPPVMPPQDTRRTVLSLRGTSCVSCAERLTNQLAEQAGVESARFDPIESEIVVLANPAFDALRTAEALKGNDSLEVVEGAGLGGSAAPPSEPRGDARTLSTDGRDVRDLGEHSEPGKVTIFDFSAYWCEPCRVLEEHLRAEVERRPDLAYRKLDIGERDSALAKRYLKDEAELPYVIVFGKDGREVARIEGLDVARVDQAIGRAGATK